MGITSKRKVTNGFIYRKVCWINNVFLSIKVFFNEHPIKRFPHIEQKWQTIINFCRDLFFFAAANSAENVQINPKHPMDQLEYNQVEIFRDKSSRLRSPGPMIRSLKITDIILTIKRKKAKSIFWKNVDCWHETVRKEDSCENRLKTRGSGGSKF